MSDTAGQPAVRAARIDLHAHSCCSDGTLTPTALVDTAAARGVSLLALTDHDTLAGIAEAQAACTRQGIRFVPGIELSCHWHEVEIHVLGLSIDPTHATLDNLCREQLIRRRERVAAMARRLTALGLPGHALADQALNALSPTRAHLAQALSDQGLVDGAQQAFERYLAVGRPAYVAAAWPPLATIIATVSAAGGLAVLAHPHRYGLPHARLAALASDFKRLGGTGIEVSVAGMSPAEAAAAARLARRFELAGSIGSDFHQPGLPWRPLGRFAKLPEAVTPLTARLAQARDLPL